MIRIAMHKCLVYYANFHAPKYSLARRSLKKVSVRYFGPLSVTSKEEHVILKR